MENLLKDSDVVTVHVPYFPATSNDPGTYHLINRTNIKLMKEGSYLINTSRGPVVDEGALIEALRNKTIAGNTNCDAYGWLGRSSQKDEHIPTIYL